MRDSIKYLLSGADRFQLYFDSFARKKSGTGNVIRAVLTFEGRIPESVFRNAVVSNVFIRLLASLALKRKRFSPLFYLEEDRMETDAHAILTFHQRKPDESIEIFFQDCPLTKGHAVRLDVAYEGMQTYLIISVNHVLMDYGGMNNLIESFSRPEKITAWNERKSPHGSFSAKLRMALSATRFIAAAGGRRIRYLEGSGGSTTSFEVMSFTKQESQNVADRLEHKIRTNALAFYLASVMLSFKKHEDLLSGKGDFFIPVPVDRRAPSAKHELLSNFISFLYFKADLRELTDLRQAAAFIAQQMILQARKNKTAAFSALLDLFRYVPSTLYRACIDLPSAGRSCTFAFSVLNDLHPSAPFFDEYAVSEITHYAPVLTPPGLNIVFTESSDRLKIILSFDESRISAEQARLLLNTIRTNLLG